MKQILKSYFYWTYPRGSFHYDVMVSLILVFIFVTPWLWDYGAKPRETAVQHHPIQVLSAGGHSMLVTVAADDVTVPVGTTASDRAVKLALRSAIQQVTGDAVFIEKWDTSRDANGATVWRVWAHR